MRGQHLLIAVTFGNDRSTIIAVVISAAPLRADLLQKCLHLSDTFAYRSDQDNRPMRLTQCCTQFKSPEDKILCVLYLYYNVAFTFK